MIFYHGTKKSRLKSITEHGLGGVKLYGYSYSDPARVYMTTHLPTAEFYARLNQGSRDDKTVVLKIDIEDLDKDLLRNDYEDIWSYPGVIKKFEVVLQD